MHELVTDGTSGPTTPQHCLVPIEIFSAHSTETGFNPEQHRFPFTTGFSDTHSGGSIAGQPAEKQGEGDATRLYAVELTIKSFALVIREYGKAIELETQGLAHASGLTRLRSFATLRADRQGLSRKDYLYGHCRIS